MIDPTPSSSSWSRAVVKLKLDRMGSLKRLINSGRAAPRHRTEYKRLIDRMADHFFPLVDALVQAGVISVEVKMDEEESADMASYASVCAEAESTSKDYGILISGRFDGCEIRA